MTVPMHSFDAAAIVIAIAATSACLNHKLLRLPATSGTLVVALVASLVVVAAEATFPKLALQARVTDFLGRIDFNQILTWSGLRGGLSIAMMLSLPPFPGRDLLLACTYAVVVFSILVQGLTVRRVLVHYGIGTR
jgi:NhaP-type Na+/H+ or K+/H+ antiporter